MRHVQDRIEKLVELATAAREHAVELEAEVDHEDVINREIDGLVAEVVNDAVTLSERLVQLKAAVDRRVSFQGIEPLTAQAADQLVDAEQQSAALFETEGSEGLPVEPKP